MTRALKDFLADLVSGPSHCFLPCLLRDENRAKWSSVRALCQQDDRLAKRYDSVTTTLESGVMVTWLDHPSGETGHCVVVFYSDDDMSSTVAVVNRALVRELSPS
jgi:hypothetical protein